MLEKLFLPTSLIRIADCFKYASFTTHTLHSLTLVALPVKVQLCSLATVKTTLFLFYKIFDVMINPRVAIVTLMERSLYYYYSNKLF